MSDPLKFSEHFLRDPGDYAGCGFNARIMGHSYTETIEHRTHGIGAIVSGWHLADSMARAGKIYAVHNFHHSHECNGHAFPYGGTFVCNSCGESDLVKDWWKIKCFQDGNAWCCVGPDFEDLQSSDCFAFGESYETAIKAYGDLMTREELKL